ncbi:MAG: polysaccharide deacetylase family protein [Firmicutes bacterium]|nr:polysaccharide deacetylase family protein [Bacillota bacterium]
MKLLALRLLLITLVFSLFFAGQGMYTGQALPMHIPIPPPPPVETPLFPVSRIPVLVYHSIMPSEFYYPQNANNPWVLHLDTFYAQMRYLYENSFSTITTEQLIDFLFYGAYLPYNPIILTFDDGYLDNALFAAPIMRQFGFVGMQFLITEKVSEATRRMTASPLQLMGTRDIAATMDVFEFGSHTHAMHHAVNGVPLLALESMENIKADILRSFISSLTFTTGFAYPFGRYSPNAKRALTEAGVLFAFTTREGYLKHDTEPLRIPRFSVTGGPNGWTMQHFSDVVWGRG